MADEIKFYPEEPTITVNPLDKKGELRYVLEGYTGKITQKEITLKYAFPAKLGTASQALKEKVRNILVNILDISRFSITPGRNRATIVVPLAQLADVELLPKEGTIPVPVLVKLVKEGEEPLELKCQQEIRLITDITETPTTATKPDTKKPATTEESAEEEPAEVDFGDDKEDAEESKAKEKPAPATPPKDAKKDAKPDAKDAKKDTKDTKDAKKDAKAGKEAPQDETSEENAEDEEEKEERDESGLYSGLMAIDYGTTNSAIVVRDPRYAAEEVRGQLSTEQWDSLCKWVDAWLINHLSKVEPNETDLFVENLTRIVPNANLPKCGTAEDEIKRSLIKLDDNIRQQIITETLCRLSNFSQESTSPSAILMDVAPEVMHGFESVIDSKTLESQRYFVLELDENAGAHPISSTMQIISAPDTEDLNLLMEETKVDMGARVGLLLKSAASGGADIRQFILSIKRYFGRDEVIEVVPAENGGKAIQFPADTLCRLAYRELITRAIGDIHRRAENGLFQDAEWPCSMVATFPTSYPASLRRSLKEILTDLNIKEIDTRFDEATAAAVYYVWREVGADPVCAMNGLMARCRRDRHGRSYQNILLYDLGGGTTDIALIQLLYEELAIFAPDADRGNGGRYFRITPRLLGTTGHRYIGGDLITLWLFRYVKSKIADCLLQLINSKNIEAPMDSQLSQVLLNLPDSLVESDGNPESTPKYRVGALMDWSAHPLQQMRQYNQLNENIIDVIVPTRFVNDPSKTSNFFTLWEMTEELKKTLGTPVASDKNSGLAQEWPEEIEFDSGQLFNFVRNAHPWLVDSGAIQQDDLRLSITQQELTKIARDSIKQSLSLAVSLSKARLLTQDHRDRIDRLILSGQSCNMQCVQVVANEVFRESDGVFDYDPANVRFDRDSAKTSVALGACIGRYLESVRIDPFNEKTKQMLRDGYDQVELVIENLFTYLSCRLAYDSLVAMVTIFDQGHELNLRSYTDRRPVARTSIHNLRPVQEKFWIYRIDFEGAEPQYLGLINAEAVASDNNFEDFRKFREEYLVGFEADAELFVRAFFLPRGPKTIVAKNFQEPDEEESLADLIEMKEGKAKGSKAKAEDSEAVKPGEKPGAKPGEKPGAKPGEKPGAKPGEKPGAKPEAAAKLVKAGLKKADELDDTETPEEPTDDTEKPELPEPEDVEKPELPEPEEPEDEDESEGPEDEDEPEDDAEDEDTGESEDEGESEGPEDEEESEGPEDEGESEGPEDEEESEGSEGEEEKPKPSALTTEERYKQEQRRFAEQRASDNEGSNMVLTHSITSQEIFDRRPVFQAGTKLEYTIQYPDGKEYRCAISEPLPIRDRYEFHIEVPGQVEADPDNERVVKFSLNEEETDEATLILDERGHMIMLTSSPYDIQIWADIEYVPQKMDIHYDPFCGHH